MTSYNLAGVMAGDIDSFIEALSLDDQTRQLATVGE